MWFNRYFFKSNCLYIWIIALLNSSLLQIPGRFCLQEFLLLRGFTDIYFIYIVIIFISRNGWKKMNLFESTVLLAMLLLKNQKVVITWNAWNARHIFVGCVLRYSQLETKCTTTCLTVQKINDRYILVYINYQVFLYLCFFFYFES